MTSSTFVSLLSHFFRLKLSHSDGISRQTPEPGSHGNLQYAVQHKKPLNLGNIELKLVFSVFENFRQVGKPFNFHCSCILAKEKKKALELKTCHQNFFLSLDFCNSTCTTLLLAWYHGYRSACCCLQTSFRNALAHGHNLTYVVLSAVLYKAQHPHNLDLSFLLLTTIVLSVFN